MIPQDTLDRLSQVLECRVTAEIKEGRVWLFLDGEAGAVLDSLDDLLPDIDCMEELI